MAPGTATPDTEAIGIDAMISRMAADVAYRGTNVRNRIRYFESRRAAMMHRENGKPFLQKGVELREPVFVDVRWDDTINRVARLQDLVE